MVKRNLLQEPPSGILATEMTAMYMIHINKIRGIHSTTQVSDRIMSHDNYSMC